MRDAVAFYRSGYEKARIDITVDAGLWRFRRFAPSGMPTVHPRPEKTSGHLLLPLTRQELLVIPAEVEQRAIRLHFDDPVRQPAYELTVVRHETPFMFLINYLESMNGHNHPAWDKMAGQNPP